MLDRSLLSYFVMYNSISALLVNATVNSIDLTIPDLRSAVADRHSSKKRQMHISK